MENTTLLKANIKKHKGALFGIFILTLLVAAALGTVLTVWSNSEKYIVSELDRAGFGELTAWVANLSDTSDLKNSIEALEEIERVETQSPVSYTHLLRYACLLKAQAACKRRRLIHKNCYFLSCNSCKNFCTGFENT